MSQRTVALATIIAAAVLAGGVVAALIAVGSDDGESRTRAFFTLPTPSSCARSDLVIVVDDSHFSAFVPGSGRRSTQGKYLIVKFTAEGTAPPAASEFASRFVLAEASGRRYAPVDELVDNATTVAEIRSARQLVFDVPQALTAAKLTFDDGCVHQEWLAP